MLACVLILVGVIVGCVVYDKVKGEPVSWCKRSQHLAGERAILIWVDGKWIEISPVVKEDGSIR